MKCELRLVVNEELDIEHVSWKAWHVEDPAQMTLHVCSARQAACSSLSNVVIESVVQAFATLEGQGFQQSLPLAAPPERAAVTPHCLDGEEALFEEF